MQNEYVECQSRHWNADYWGKEIHKTNLMSRGLEEMISLAVPRGFRNRKLVFYCVYICRGSLLGRIFYIMKVMCVVLLISIFFPQ
jgi:hypothetical protein